MSDLPHYNPDRLDREPTIIFGCTDRDIQTVLKIGFSAGFLVAFLIGFSTGIWFVAGACWIGIVIASLMFGAPMLAKAKRGKPIGYHQQRFQIWTASLGLGSTSFLHRTGRWNSHRHV